MPEAGATAEEAVEGGTPPWRPDPDCWLPCSVCLVAVVVIILLALALVLPTRVTAAVATCFHFLWLFKREGLSSRRYRIIHACQRRYASPSSRNSPWSGFMHPLVLMKGCLHCLGECVSSWYFRRWPRFSRRAAARSVGVSKPLHKGGSASI